MTTTRRPPPPTESNAGPFFLGFVIFFLLPSTVVGVKTMLIVAAVVASVIFLCKLWELRPVSSPSPAPVRPAQAISAPVEEEERGESSQVTQEGVADHHPSFTDVTDSSTDVTAPDSSGTTSSDEAPRRSELTIDELVTHLDRIDAIDDEGVKDEELRALPYVTDAVFDAAIRRIENRPPPRIISVETNRALGFLLSAFATEGSDYVATADIHQRESKNDDAIAELTPLQFAKRLALWLAPTGITSEPLKPYIGGNRKGYVKSKVLAYVDAPGELEVRA